MRTFARTNGSIFGTDADDTIRGGIGDDYVNAYAGNDTVFGDRGNDDLVGGDGDDRLYGGVGDDFLQPGAGRNSIFGGGGDDYVLDWAGEDTLIGGRGFDMIGFDLNAEHGVMLNLATGIIADDGFGHTERVSGFEGADGSRLADTFIGDSANNSFSVSVGDTVVGGQGDDYILIQSIRDVSASGGEGQDTLALDGIYGDETGAVYYAQHGVNVSLAKGLVLDDGFGASGAISGFESVSGESKDDTLTGGSGANTLFGANGDDILSGRGGNDIIRGGNGSDILSGGSEADTFVYGHNDRLGYDDVGLGNRPAGQDTILDFTQGEDKVDLSALVRKSGPITFVGEASTEDVGALSYAFVGGDTVVTLNVDTTDSHDLTIKLTGEIALTAGDFILG